MPPEPAPKAAAAPPQIRLGSIDVYRGFVMLLMMAEVLHLAAVAQAWPKTSWWKPLWQFLALHQSHVEWTGCTLHDLIQPSFSFLVGAALPFSLANRLNRGESLGWATLRATWRSLLLIALGVFLRSTHSEQTRFTFEDTLSQIGLGYLPLFLLGLTKQRWQWVALVVVLVSYWVAFICYPLPGPDFPYLDLTSPDKSLISQADVARLYPVDSFQAHWNKNSNLAWAFDTWFLNIFPHAKIFTHNGGGYATLSFIPTLGTMILGLIAGGWLKEDRRPREKLLRLSIASLICLVLGFGLDNFGICPSVKRIWTPAWTIFSGGWCFLFMAAFYAVIDVKNYRTWAFPLTVIGMNSIAAYLTAHLFEDFIKNSLQIHLGKGFFQILGSELEPFLLGFAILSVFWLILLWMHQRKLFLRI
ncbi:MAG: acyltransferase family protein [Pirellulaceae bacterium]